MADQQKMPPAPAHGGASGRGRDIEDARIAPSGQNSVDVRAVEDSSRLIRKYSDINGIGIVGKLRAVDIEVIVPDPWIAVSSFLNGWTNLGGSGVANLSYTKHPDGTVEMKGAITGGLIGAACTTLPRGYRPDSYRYFACISNGAFGYLYIDSAGSVVPAAGSSSWFGINVRFLASDSRPQILSSFPIQIKTDLKESPLGVIILNTSFGEAKRAPQKLPGAAPNHVEWSFVRKHDGNYVQVENITGLPYSQRTKVRLLIIGKP